MKHSIIIPNRGRDPYLKACLRHIDAAYANLGWHRQREELQIVVCNDEPHGKFFNKPKALNKGIGGATGDVLTFLDADAIVGSRWPEGVAYADWKETWRLCYRVRYFDREQSGRVLQGVRVASSNGCCGLPATYTLVSPTENSDVDPAESARSSTILDASTCRVGWETYGAPTIPAPFVEETSGQPWGNSQFSITRERLADFRFNEEYEGRGLEDIEFFVRMFEAWGDNYRGKLLTDVDHALIHLTHDYEETWRTHEAVMANAARFKARQKKT